MNSVVLAEVKGAAPERDGTPLDLCIGNGMTVLLGNDRQRVNRYLKMVAGVVPALRGDVLLFGASPTHEDHGGRELRRRVGYVTPSAPLLSVLDGVRNVMLPALYHHLAPESEVMPKVQALLDEMGGEGDHHALPAFMPELQRRMLLVARALILEPRLLFVEQLLSGLDSDARERLCAYLRYALANWSESLVVAGNEPELASIAAQVVFIGEQRHWVFAGWQSLLTCDDPAVQEFIEQERRFCSFFQG